MTAAHAIPGLRDARRDLAPWFVKLSPEFYDDACDVGYGWEGWASGEDDAIAQALEQCHRDNDRALDCHEEDVDPSRADIHVAEIDFRRFAGPLVHWARQAGVCDGPLWEAMEAAVATAKLPVVAWALGPVDVDRSVPDRE